LREGFHHPLHHEMAPVSPRNGRSRRFRDQALQAHIAGGAEEIRADLTLLEWADEVAGRPARQQPF
jgi:hypothetical protein